MTEQMHYRHQQIPSRFQDSTYPLGITNFSRNNPHYRKAKNVMIFENLLLTVS
jgi:hypothetical protein